MSDSPIFDKLAALKKQSEINRKPFPVWALLILYENGPRTLYNNYFEDFILLRDWLGPIQLTPHSEHLPRLHRTYEIQELANILNTTQENLNHGYQTALSIIQLTSHIPLMSSQVSTIQTEC